MPRILVLDDEPLISMMVQDWLTELAYETVGPANSVTGALGLIDSTPLDAAILDLSLGKEDCYPVAEALRARGIPFVLVTGYGHVNVADCFQDAPILSKPIDFQAIKDAMCKLLENQVPT